MDLSEHGINAAADVYRNPATSQLYTHALARREGRLAEGGPLVVDTGVHTGRSPKDKFLVREPGSEERIWWGDVNAEISEEHFDGLRDKVAAYLGERETLYVVDAFAGADPAHRIAVRVITDRPYHALFAKTMFIEPTEEELAAFEPQALVLHAPDARSRPGRRTAPAAARSSSCIPAGPRSSIGGTFYAGEIKKSIFTVMNDRLPLEGVLPMHCSANVGAGRRRRDLLRPLRHGQDDAVGRSGAPPDRRRRARLGRRGRLQLRGRLLREGDPPLRRGRAADLPHDAHLRDDPRERRRWTSGACSTSTTPRRTENTRAAYDLEQIDNALPEKRAGHPRSVIFLTADAFGILPPIARLSRDQALFYFLSGFTAKLAGTEIGVQEPQPTFSACFGAPFLPQPPVVYARMLGEEARRARRARVARQHGLDGRPVRRGLAHADRGDACAPHAPRSPASSRSAEYREDPIFGFEVPVAVPAVDATLLDPRSTWHDPEAYDRKARELARMFRDNFEKFDVSEPVSAAGPRV